MVHGSKGTLGENANVVWHDLPELRAVQNGSVYPISDDFVVHASQFVLPAAELIAKLIHPEAFSQVGKK
jgi:ABC-type Fe3+-hydroxamate transport system substrate-binding protein